MNAPLKFVFVLCAATLAGMLLVALVLGIPWREKSDALVVVKRDLAAARDSLYAKPAARMWTIGPGERAASLLDATHTRYAIVTERAVIQLNGGVALLKAPTVHDTVYVHETYLVVARRKP